MDIQSPSIAITKEIITSTFLTAVMRGRIFEVVIREEEEAPEIGDPIIIYRIMASEQWIFLCIVTEAPPNPLRPNTDQVISPDPVVIGVIDVVPIISFGTTLLPSPITIPLTLTAPVISVDLTLIPDAVTIPLVIPTPNVLIDTTLTPDPVVIPLVILDPVITSGTIVAPDTVTIPLVITTPTIVLELTLTPSPVTITLAIPTPTVDVEGGEAFTGRLGIEDSQLGNIVPGVDSL